MMILMIKLDPKDRDDGFLKTHPVLAAGSFLWAISAIEGRQLVSQRNDDGNDHQYRGNHCQKKGSVQESTELMMTAQHMFVLR